MTRWSTLLLDEASLGEMPALPTAAVLRHADLVVEQQPEPLQLYERWERQQWSAEAIELEPDRVDFDTRIPRTARTMLSESIATFVIGEYTALDHLGPILTGAPEEHDHIFLGTQIADEARHTRVMLRIAQELLDYDPDPRRMLARAWTQITPAHRDLCGLESRIVGDLRLHPSDYRRWLRAVVLFHLLTEGVLALVGQRIIVQSLRNVPLMPGVKAAFTAMCRDESRHVGYGLHALRQGMAAGEADDIYDVLEQAAPMALRIDEGRTRDVPDDALTMRQLSIDSLRRQLRLIGVEDSFVQHLVQLAERPLAGAGA